MSSKSPVTCHVLDASLGQPAKGVIVGLQRHQKLSDDGDLFSFNPIAHGQTDADGRCTDLFAPRKEDAATQLEPGIYKITFRVKEYFESTNRQCFYPWVEIAFEIEDPVQHYHIPLLISPYSYTTYRGS